MPELPDVEGGLAVGDGEVGLGSVRKDNAGHPDWGPRQTNWALRRLIDVRPGPGPGAGGHSNAGPQVAPAPPMGGTWPSRNLLPITSSQSPHQSGAKLN